MAGLWEAFSFESTLTAKGTGAAVELFHNEVDDHLFASAPITIVDGICTLITNTDDLFLVRFVVASEQLNSGQIQALQRHQRQIWYGFYASRGPLVFRMPSKKTLWPEDKLWVDFFKAEGSSASIVRGGIQIFEVRHS